MELWVCVVNGVHCGCDRCDRCNADVNNPGGRDLIKLKKMSRYGSDCRIAAFAKLTHKAYMRTYIFLILIKCPIRTKEYIYA